MPRPEKGLAQDVDHSGGICARPKHPHPRQGACESFGGIPSGGQSPTRSMEGLCVKMSVRWR